MPLFEYVCKQCGAAHEILVRGGESPACPACGSADLEKQAGRFAAVMGGRRGAAPSCDSCCSQGQCPMRD